MDTQVPIWGCLPHTRGDEPHHIRDHGYDVKVCPTRVGMHLSGYVPLSSDF